MTVTEKAAYLRGLAEGLNLDAEKPETKILSAVIDLLDDLALTTSDLEDELTILGEQVDAVDEDLDELESYVYDECEDECCGDEEDYYEVECPACGEVICVDEDILAEGSIHCPNCDELLEFEFDCDACNQEESDE